MGIYAAEGNKMRLFLLISSVVLILAATPALAQSEWGIPSSGKNGYLDRPPVFVTNEPYFPLTGLDFNMPRPGEIIPAVDISGISSDDFRQNGKNVQPGLDVEINWIRAGALRGFKGGWAAGISVPWYRNKVKGNMHGLPTTSIAEGFGNILLAGKKIIWRGNSGRLAVVAAGVEFPSGKNNSVFGQSNAATNAYWRNFPQRLPLGWQPSTGTFNGVFAISYGQYAHRYSWEGFLAYKAYSADDEDVKVGNIFIASVDGTYGISKPLAVSLGFTLKSQADDSYPEAPPPGVQQPLTAGTTTHGATLYLDSTIHYIILQKVTVGVGIRVPIVKPDAGMVPSGQVSLIFYPNI